MGADHYQRLDSHISVLDKCAAPDFFRCEPKGQTECGLERVATPTASRAGIFQTRVVLLHEKQTIVSLP